MAMHSAFSSATLSWLAVSVYQMMLFLHMTHDSAQLLPKSLRCGGWFRGVTHCQNLISWREFADSNEGFFGGRESH